MKAGLMDLDFKMYFEPDSGIADEWDLTDELCKWANRQKRDLVILEESMDPLVEIDGKRYRCHLAEPSLAGQNNPIWKGMCWKGINHSPGRFLGYKWVYLYEE